MPKVLLSKHCGLGKPMDIVEVSEMQARVLLKKKLGSLVVPGSELEARREEKKSLVEKPKEEKKSPEKSLESVSEEKKPKKESKLKKLLKRKK